MNQILYMNLWYENQGALFERFQTFKLSGQHAQEKHVQK